MFVFTAGFTSPSVKTDGPTQTASLSLISVESQPKLLCGTAQLVEVERERGDAAGSPDRPEELNLVFP